MIRILSAGLVLLFSALAPAAEEAAPYQVGDRLDPIVLKDQHDQTHMLTEDIRLVLFTTGMKGGAVVREVLDREPPDYLASRRAMFISNISGMPGLIAKMVALPSMRNHKYPIVLDRDGTVTRRIPSQEDSATLLRLEGLQIQSIEFTRSSQDVRQAVDTLSAEAVSGE